MVSRMAATATADPLVAKAWAALETVPDPEVPVLTVLDLGIVRDVRRAGDSVEVTLTPTYSGCPATAAIALDIRRALDAAGLADARLVTRLDPPWTTDWMSEAGRAKLRAYGIAPPVGRAGGRRALFGEDPAVACPHCGATATEKVSEFGSTACKALYRCTACREPFDYFKCI